LAFRLVPTSLCCGSSFSIAITVIAELALDPTRRLD
jgi:hypothetical protein